MRKRRIYRLKRTKRRFIIRRRRIRRIAKKTEVKYRRFIYEAPVAILNKATASQVLHANTTVFNDSIQGLIHKIDKGVAINQRVGNHIFVKKIVVKGHIWICPSSGDDKFYGNTSVRVLVSTAATMAPAGGTDLPTFFATTQPNKTLDWINRQFYTVHADRLVILRNTEGDVQGTTKSARMPGYTPFRISINVNKPITFTDNNNLKDQESNIYTVNLLGYNSIASFDTQLACTSICATVYYTDA